jgi:hypothetical protein
MTATEPGRGYDPRNPAHRDWWMEQVRQRTEQAMNLPGGITLAWADGEPEPTMDAETFAEVIDALGVVGRSWLDIELSMLGSTSPFRRNPTKAVSPACYEASWGWVHSRPSCRCVR